MDKITLPRHIFEKLDEHVEHGCQKYLVTIRPTGEGDIDGCHSDAQEVAKAKKLIESIRVITPPSGTIFAMITVEPVPTLVNDDINYQAVGCINMMAVENAKRRRKGSGRIR